MKKNKVLIIRFSSFGDIVQCSTVVEYLKTSLENTEIHWVTRSEFGDLVGLNKNVAKVIKLDKRLGINGLFLLFIQLKNEKYNIIYDAHNNLRSNIIHLLFRLTLTKSFWITRSKDRVKRILLFYFKINLFPKPFKGIDSFLNPLKRYFKKDFEFNVSYNFPVQTLNKIENNFNNNNQNIITLVPSAAWPMKRWPIEHWKELILLLPNFNFIILGGREDLFCEEIKNIAKDRITNLAGELSLMESTALISKSKLVISADTGLLHVADVLKVKAISLMGPSAFGFTKSELIKTLQVELSCRPCSKDGSGSCKQSVYQKCMVDITPNNVKNAVINLLN